MKKFIASAITAAVLGVGSLGASATPLLDFTVDPTSAAVGPLPGGGLAPFVADKIVGGYIEDFLVTGPGTFATTAIWTAGQFFRNDGVTPVTALTSGLGNRYGLYAVFTATGTFSSSGTSINFTANGGAISLFLDDNLDTIADDIDAGLNPIISGNADDVLLASAPLVSGEGNGTSTGQAQGNFGLTFQPVLLSQPSGEAFFIAPRPFHLTVQSKGQFNFFEPVIGQTFRLNGSADVFFTPEPSSVGLLGLALVGAGAVVRRSRARKVAA